MEKQSTANTRAKSGRPAGGLAIVPSPWWLAAALFWLLTCTVLAYLQPPAPIISGNWSSEFSFLQPIERNAIRRLPTIDAKLNSVFFSDDGRHGWAVGDRGTIVATNDGGKTWVAQTSGTPHGLHSVAFQIDDQRGWAVGEGGTMMATSDGGKTWVAQTIDTGSLLMSVAFDSDGQRGWAVGNDGTIVATSDGGKTWARVAQTIDTGSLLKSVAFDSDGQRGWAVGEAGTIVATSDGGKTWARVAQLTEDVRGTRKYQPRSNSIAFHSDGQRGWAVGDYGRIVATSDGGKTWGSAQTSGTRSELNSIVFHSDALRGWAVGKGGTIVATSDGGKTWVAQTSGTPHELHSVTFRSDGQRGWAVGDAGTIVATNDGGKTWVAQASGPTYGLYSVAFHSDGQRVWAVGEGGTMMATNDGGKTWVAQASGPPNWLHSVAFHSDGQRGWAVGNYGRIVATSDGGKTWVVQTSGTTSLLRSVAFHSDGQRGWAVGNDGTIVATSDGGKTWVAQASGPTYGLYSVAFHSDGQRGWAVGSRGTIVATNDGGKTWVAQASGTTNSLHSVAFHSNGQRGWAVGDRGTIVATNDGGKTWVAQASGTRSELHSVAFHSDGQRGWAVGDQRTIVATSDGGKTWADALGPYQRYPAPWFWIALLPGIGLVSLAFRRRAPSVASLSVADVAASDAAVAKFADDRLEFGTLARGLSRFLRNTKTTPPLTLAITGDWGAGKSSLMQLLCADLRRSGHQPIWFNAWHHQKEEHLFAALLGAIRSQAAPSSWKLEGCMFRLHLLWIRSKKHFALFFILFTAVAALCTLGVLHPTDGWRQLLEWVQNMAQDTPKPGAVDYPSLIARYPSLIAQPLVLLTAAIALFKAMKTFGVDPAVLMAGLSDRFRLKDASVQNTFRMTFAQQFQEVVDALPHRMVIVIDDLDRCRSEVVLEVMEAVNFLISAGPCFVVFGMATERVQAALGIAFERIAKELVQIEQTDDSTDPDRAEREKRRSYARDYLEKLINLEIKVPVRGDIAAYKLLVLSDPPDRAWFKELTAALASVWPVYIAVVAIAVGIALGITFDPFDKNKANEVVPTATKTAAPPSTEVPPRPPPDEKPPVQPMSPDMPSDRVVFSSGQSNPWSAIILAPAIPLALVLGVIAVILSRLGAASREVADSNDFKMGLEIWTELVAQHRNTPRTIKRWGNRLRYFAMLQQGVSLDETAGQAIVNRIRARLRWIPKRGRTEREASGASAPLALNERQLIAIGAMHEVFGARWWERLNEITKNYRDDAQSVHQMDRLIHRLIALHRAAEGVNWPPTESERQAFERLLAGIRLPIDPVIIRAASTSA